MFERFDSGARGVLFRARLSAFGSDAIEPRHLLAGLVAEDAGRRALERLGLGVQSLQALELPRRPTGAVVPAEPRMGEAMKLVLRFAHQESAGSPELTPMHLVLGLLRHESTSGGGVLHELGLTFDEARRVAAVVPVATPLTPPVGRAEDAAERAGVLAEQDEDHSVTEDLRLFSTLEEDCRRVLFHGRAQVDELGSDRFEARHLLLALVEDAAGREALVALGADAATLHRAADSGLRRRGGDAVARDADVVDMADDLDSVLRRARSEADAEGALLVSLGHLVLGLLAIEDSAGALHQAGMTLDEATRRLRQQGGASPTPP